MRKKSRLRIHLEPFMCQSYEAMGADFFMFSESLSANGHVIEQQLLQFPIWRTIRRRSTRRRRL